MITLKSEMGVTVIKTDGDTPEIMADTGCIVASVIQSIVKDRGYDEDDDRIDDICDMMFERVAAACEHARKKPFGDPV